MTVRSHTVFVQILLREVHSEDQHSNQTEI